MPPRQRKRPRIPSIALVDMGRTSQVAMRVMAANIQTLVEVPVETLEAMTIPEEAFQPHRGQHDAGLVLKHLARFPFPGCARVLAVANVDLCTPILTYVFGEAELGLKLAVVSDFRLKTGEDGGPAPEELYYERLVKVALHEIAHTLSLYHCETPKCLMRISPRLSHLDELDISFCERCRFELHRNVRQLHE